MNARRPRRHHERDVYGREDVALVTASEAGSLDTGARERHGVAERVLMENAGRAAALVLDRLFPRGRVRALAGSGNNGGDALVMARVLRGWGRDVSVLACGSRPPDRSLLHGHDVTFESADALDSEIASADVLVDGLLGTGSKGAPREPIAGLIERMNDSGTPILALDLPSGVDATTGRAEGSAVRAAVTVTFGWPKLGCLLFPAREYCGRLVAVEIGFPPLRLGSDA
ncbi:MAG: NAD(P)H-hydrate epimerase, partial [Longimicrobiales bacterium]